MSFFQSAPIVSWATILSRKLNPFSKSRAKVLPQHTFTTTVSPTGQEATMWKDSKASEYSDFLTHSFTSYYTSPYCNYKLSIPPEKIEFELESGQLIGIEVRDASGSLVGVVASRQMGKLNKSACSLITWLCVVPSWRKKGVADYLLFQIAKSTLPIQVHWFRNDGWLKSIAPPVWTQDMVLRESNHIQNPHIKIVRESNESIEPLFISIWKGQNPTGIVIGNSSLITSMEFYTIQVKDSSFGALVHPTYETLKNKNCCEIIAWISYRDPKYVAVCFEALVDALPYDWVEAPEAIPRLNTSWIASQPTSWCLYGYDIGTPAMRPILPLIVA